MSCKRPLKAFQIGLTENNKPKYKIVSGKAHHIEKLHDGKWHAIYDSKLNYGAEAIVTDCIEVPCGKCIGCRLDYSKRWADRCLLEMQQHESSYFVTLTYDDEHLPHNMAINYEDPVFDEESGEALETQQVMTLVKRDLQLFFKSLRKHTGQKIRYYACGEYGGNTCRPHYHLIIFGLFLEDLKLQSVGENGFNRYTSETIDKCWKKGFSLVMDCTWETCAYTARYVTKKLNGDLAAFYELNNIQPEFVVMSRRPGIARNYLEENENVFDYEWINVKTKEGGRKISIPKYFERVKEEIDPDFIIDRKEKRKEFAMFRQKIKENRTSLNHMDYLQVEEDNLKARTKSLKRKEC